MTVKLVPFDPDWITAEKCDLHAYYRRPSRVTHPGGRQDRGRNADGTPAWDLTTPLPVRRHTDWMRKGFEYVTLTIESLGDEKVLRSLRNRGHDPQGFLLPDHVPPTCWDADLYLDDERKRANLALEELLVLVAEHGQQAVEAIKRQTQPDFVLPDSLRMIARPVETDIAVSVPERSQPIPRRPPGRPRKGVAA